MPCHRASGLNELYCSKLRHQLAHYEKKKESKGKGKGKLMGDGLPCFLSGDWFYEQVVEFEAWQREDQKKKEDRKLAQEQMAEPIAIWKREDKKQKERNEEQHQRYKEAVAMWENNLEAVRVAKKRFTVRKPTQEKLE